MSDLNYTIKIYDDINDAALKTAWIKLQHETEVFPQMFYEWIEPWWRNVGKKGRELHVVTILEENEIVGIAPFCISKKFGLKILQSIPIHFGDFYSMLTIKKNEKSILKKILNYSKSLKKWDVVHFFNLNSDDSLKFCLDTNNQFKEKQIVEIQEANFQNLNFEDFLLTLSKNTRGQYRKKWNRLVKEGEVKFEIICDSASYLRNTSEMNALYNLRWANDNIPLLNEEYYKMRNEAIQPLFDMKKAVLYKLSFNGNAIAYRLGFLSRKTFFDWKVVHDPDYNYYSPGNLLVGKIIEDVIAKGFYKFNFMTGNYRYKQSWIVNQFNTSNSEYFYAKSLSLGSLYLSYRLKHREKIREIYYRLKQINLEEIQAKINFLKKNK